MKPCVLDPKDVRALREGMFSKISRAFGAAINSELVISIRNYHKLDSAKQVH